MYSFEFSNGNFVYYQPESRNFEEARSKLEEFAKSHTKLKENFIGKIFCIKTTIDKKRSELVLIERYNIFRDKDEIILKKLD